MFFESNIFSQMDELGVDYYKTVSTISAELGVTETLVEDVIGIMIKSNMIKESRFLELSEKEISDRRLKKQKEIELELKKAGVVKNGA